MIVILSPSADGRRIPAFARRVTLKIYSVYVMASKSRTLYTGVTNNLERRVIEHKRKLIPGFTGKYNIDRLV